MSGRARALVRAVAIAAAVLVVIVSAIALWVLGTQPGAHWAFERLGAALPGELRVGDLRGSIRGPLHVRHLHYQAETYELTVADLRVAWSLRDLVRQRLQIGRLRADSVTVRFKTPHETARDEQRKVLPDVDLPLDILIRDARITRLAFYQPGTVEPLAVDTLRLSATIRDTLDVERFAVRSRHFDLTLQGSALPRGVYPVALDSRWTVRLEGRAPWSGDGTLTGSLDTLVVAQRVSAPFEARVDVRVFQPLRDLRFEGLVDFSRLTLRALDPELPGTGSWRGTLRGSGRIDAFSSSGDIASRATEWGPLDATYRVRRSGARWIVEHLDVAVPGGRTRLRATGDVRIGDEGVRLDLDARWADLTWPTTGPSSWSSRSGRARLTGTLDRYRLVADAGLTVPRVPEGRWHLEGRGDREAIDLARFTLDLDEGRIAGHGRVAWSPDVTWRASASGSGFSTAPLGAHWPGSLGFEARSTGRVAESGPVGALIVERVEGEVRGRPVAAAGSVRFAAERYDLSDARATWGPARFTADGRIGPVWDLGWSFDVPNLAIALPAAGGALAGRGHVSGRDRARRVQASVTGDSLVWGELRMRDLDLDADLDPTRAVRLDLRARDLRYSRFAVDSLAVTGRGPRADQRWTLWAQGARDRLDLDLTLAGSDLGPGWHGTLERLDLGSRAAGDWALAAPAEVSASPEAVSMRDFCWTSGEARLCGAVDWTSRGAWNIDAEIARLPLALLGPVLPAKMNVTGPIEGDVRAGARPDGVLIAEIDLAPGPGEIRYLGEGGDTARVRFDRGTLSARSDERALVAALDLDLPDAGTLDARLDLPGYNLRRVPGEQGLAGRLTADLHDLSVAQAFLEGVQGTRGTLRADLALGGTLAVPAATGELRLAEGRALVPAAGLELRDIELRAARDEDGRATFAGTARSGPGSVRVEGRASLAGGEGASLNARLTGERFQVMNTTEMELLVTPDVTVDVQGPRVGVTGQLDVPRARLEPSGARDETVAIAEDVVVVQAAKANREPERVLQARVRLVLGGDVRVRAFGLDAQPTGSILIVESPGQPTRGTGELRVTRGTYTAYGQDLAIERGRLLFGGGPVANPGVDLRATRTASDGVVAGFEVQGTLREPIMTVFSVPAMGEAQALSYILFGRPLDRVSTGEGALASRIATSLEVPGGNLLLRQVTSQLGLEEARLESDAGLQEASLVLGRFLSPKLYFQYGIGLFDAVNTFRLQYALSRMWSVGAEVARENRAEVQYRVEW